MEDFFSGIPCPLPLVKLYGIDRGWLKYLPVGIPAVRNVKTILDNIYQTHSRVEIRGFSCLYKSQIRAAIHRRVLARMGKTCIVCGATPDRHINVHHIKPSWRTWNNAWGFTTLCHDCHKLIQTGLPVSDSYIQNICIQVSTPDSPLYDPQDPAVYQEPTLTKLTGINYFYIS